MKRLLLLPLLFAACLSATAQGNPELSDTDTFGYLYCHISAHGGWPAYAMSQDGIHFHDLLCGDSIFAEDAEDVIDGEIPYLCRAKDWG